MPPKVSATLRAAATTCSSSRMSLWIGRALPPACSTSAAAVKIVPGSLGTFAGLRTDERARVLDVAGAPIPGLYAAGNGMASVMAGNYPSGGITHGPAMTFGYVAARHIESQPPETVGNQSDSTLDSHRKVTR